MKIVFAVSTAVFLLAVPYVGAIELYGLSPSWNVEWLAALAWTAPGVTRFVLLPALAIAMASGGWIGLRQFRDIPRLAEMKQKILAGDSTATASANECPGKRGAPSMAAVAIDLLLTVYVQILWIGLLFALCGGNPGIRAHMPEIVVALLAVMAIGVAIRVYRIKRSRQTARIRHDDQPSSAHDLRREEIP